LKVAQVQIRLASDKPRRSIRATICRAAGLVAAAALVIFAVVYFWPARSDAPPPSKASVLPYVEPITSSPEATSIEQQPQSSDVAPGDLGEWVARLEQPSGSPPVINYPLKEHPEGAARFDDHWYKIYLGCVKWSFAYEKCKEMGGYLACVNTREENTFIMSLYPQGHLWLGGIRGDDGWRWINGENMTFSNWSYNEPNNNATNSAFFLKNDEHGRWFDVGSGDTNIQGFACEWDK